MIPRDEVRWFARQMEARLLANDHKGGWRDCTVEELLQRINDEYLELLEAVNGNPSDIHSIIAECADVANFAMMVADVVNRWSAV
jgi:NTP pyrophosphatase (non-canonical NTP hydrolase)